MVLTRVDGGSDAGEPRVRDQPPDPLRSPDGEGGIPWHETYARDLMGVLDKLLRAGEGRKLRALAGLAPDIAAY